MSGRIQQQVRSNIPIKKRRQKLVGLFLLLLLWSIVIGWGLTLVTQVPANSQLPPQVSPNGTVDIVPQRYQLGQQLYLEKCATCHIALPPAVLPSETWADIIQDPEHYGRQLTPLVNPERLLVWEYLRTYSRVRSPDEERTPYRIAQSRYFKALHPKVKLPQPIAIGSCVSCHPGGGQYDFRTLSSEWQNAP